MLKRFLLGLAQGCFLFTALTAFPSQGYAEEKYSSLSPKDAISASDPCQTNINDRTLYFSVNNRTDWTVEIVFFQGKDESNNIPEGFVKDTGTFVGGTNVPGPSVVTVDPCYAGGYKRPIQATRGLGSAKVTKDGKEATINLPDYNSGDMTKYYEKFQWDIDYTKRNDKNSVPRVIDQQLKKQK
jgi:hypothetical protein